MLNIEETYMQSDDMIKTQMMQMVLLQHDIPLVSLLENLLQDIEHKMASIDTGKTAEELDAIYKPLAYAKQHTLELIRLFEKIREDNQFTTNN